jgi:gluconate 2-dehydrogenase gamma chain
MFDPSPFTAERRISVTGVDRMPWDIPSRREFLSSAAAAFGSVWLAANFPALEAAGSHAAHMAGRPRDSFEFLTPDEAADFDAISALIIPTDESPGAREAGVVHFADRVLAPNSLLAHLGEPFRASLAELNAGVSRYVGGATRFARIPLDRQEAALRSVENLPGFGLVHMLTVMGMFCNPSYGGNQGKVGWALLGFEDTYVYQPPFGYYDRDAHASDWHK